MNQYNNANAISLNPSGSQIVIIANLVSGNKDGEFGAIFSNAPSTYSIKNAKIINRNTNVQSRGISLFHSSGILPNVTLQNVQIITGDTQTSNDEIIYVNNQSSVNIKNYSLFANKDKPSYVTFKIGTDLNHLFIHDPDLT